MQRIAPLNPNTAQGTAKELLDAVNKKVGFVPNLMATFAQSPAVLQAYLQFSETLSKTLDAKTREIISLVVAETNGCEYCAAAHSTIGKMTGLTEDEILAARSYNSTDPKRKAVIDLSLAIARNTGRITDEDFKSALDSGLSDIEITEVVANVALNFFTNSFNNVAGTDIDFPSIEPVNATA